MGIFNEQSFDHPFAKGIQGAPGVGFSLTADGNYDMNKKRLTNVGAPSANTDAATKKYVDDNSGGTPTTSILTVDSNIDMKDRYRILNLKHPVDSDEPATKQYSDSRFLDRNGSRTMIGNLNMNNNRILNLPAPSGGNQPTPLAFTDLKYVARDGTSTMTNNLNMDNKKIINLRPPTSNNDATNKKYVDDSLSPYFKKDGSIKITGNVDINNNKILNVPMPRSNNEPVTRIYGNSNYLKLNGIIPMMGNLNMNNRKIYNLSTPTNNNDAATKKYVDDNTGAPDLSDYLEKDGSVAMTGNLNINSKKIINLSRPTQDNDAVNKDYADKLVHHTVVQPSHYADQFSYLMSSAAQWTDETNGGNSFLIDKIDTLTPKNGNFHDYNHKVIYYKINKNSQGGYNYKMGMNFYRLNANTDYTLCLELLNTEYLLWHKSQISVDKGSSSGLTLGNVSIKKLSHRYTDSSNQTKFMYYYKIIINFRKLSTGNRFFLHVSVNIPQTGIDLNIYPNQFKGCYMIAYGIVGTFSNIDPDKVYDYHTAFDIKPTEVVYNVDINANNKKIFNVNLDRNINNSAATVAMVKELNPFTINYLYRELFEEIYDFNNAANYKLSSTSYGIVFNNLSSTSGNTLRDMDIPNKTIDNIKKEGLNINGYTISFSPPIGITKYTLCIVFYYWRNRKFSIKKKDTNGGISLNLYYKSTDNKITLDVNNHRSQFTMLSSFNGKKIVIWLVEDFSQNITKAKISNYNALLNLQSVRYTNEQEFEFTTEDGVLSKIMFSPNFYDTDSEQYHKVLLQEKLNGSYVI